MPIRLTYTLGFVVLLYAFENKIRMCDRQYDSTTLVTIRSAAARVDFAKQDATGGPPGTYRASI